MISHSRLIELVDYNPSTGVFIKRITGLPIKGWKDKDGYLVVQLDNAEHRMHRLAWLYVHGVMPERFIDHINMVRHDNSIANLREADHSQNACNSTARSTNKSGFKGVSWSKQAKAWRAQIMKGGKKYGIGHYQTPEEAHAAYVSKARELHGEFHRTG